MGPGGIDDSFGDDLDDDALADDPISQLDMQVRDIVLRADLLLPRLTSVRLGRSPGPPHHAPAHDVREPRWLWCTCRTAVAGRDGHARQPSLLIFVQPDAYIAWSREKRNGVREDISASQREEGGRSDDSQKQT